MAGFTWKTFIDLYLVKLNLHICIPLIISAVASITLAIQVKSESKNNAREFLRLHQRIDYGEKRIDGVESDIKKVEEEQEKTAREVLQLKLEQKYGRVKNGEKEIRVEKEAVQ